MSGWMTRLRRAAVFMLVLQIVQIGVLAASPVCEVMRNEANASAMAHGSHVAQHGEQHDMQHHAQHETAAPETNHGEHADCPMAMLCAVTAIAGQAPTVRIVESHLAENVPAYAPTAPLSAWRAPETPPPRA